MAQYFGRGSDKLNQAESDESARRLNVGGRPGLYSVDRRERDQDIIHKAASVGVGFRHTKTEVAAAANRLAKYHRKQGHSDLANAAEEIARRPSSMMMTQGAKRYRQAHQAQQGREFKERPARSEERRLPPAFERGNPAQRLAMVTEPPRPLRDQVRQQDRDRAKMTVPKRDTPEERADAGRQLERDRPANASARLANAQATGKGAAQATGGRLNPMQEANATSRLHAAAEKLAKAHKSAAMYGSLGTGAPAHVATKLADARVEHGDAGRAAHAVEKDLQAKGYDTKHLTAAINASHEIDHASNQVYSHKPVKAAYGKIREAHEAAAGALRQAGSEGGKKPTPQNVSAVARLMGQAAAIHSSNRGVAPYKTQGAMRRLEGIEAQVADMKKSGEPIHPAMQKTLAEARRDAAQATIAEARHRPPSANKPPGGPKAAMVGKKGGRYIVSASGKKIYLGKSAGRAK